MVDKLWMLLAMLLLMSLSYHRCLRMSTEALEQYVEGGQDGHRWYMCVIGHGYGGLGGGRDGGGGWYACKTKPGGLVACRKMLEHFPSVR